MKEGIITIGRLGPNYPFGVNFTGHNEGSGGPCNDEDEVQETVKALINKHKSVYKLKIVDERQVQMTLCL